jgi:hypothetical protein
MLALMYHGSVVEDSSILECNAASLGEQFLALKDPSAFIFKGVWSKNVRSRH